MNNIYKYLGILPLICTLLIAWCAGRNVTSLFQPAYDIHEINVNELKTGMHITGEINILYDYYASSDVQGTGSDDGRWYLTPVHGDSEDETKLISVRVNSEDFGKYEYLKRETEAYRAGESPLPERAITIDASVERLLPWLEPLYYEWFGEENRELAEESFVPYILVPLLPSGWLIFAVLLFVVSAFLTLWCFFGKHEPIRNLMNS